MSVSSSFSLYVGLAKLVWFGPLSVDNMRAVKFGSHSPEAQGERMSFNGKPS